MKYCYWVTIPGLCLLSFVGICLVYRIICYCWNIANFSIMGLIKLVFVRLDVYSLYLSGISYLYLNIQQCVIVMISVLWLFGEQ